MNTNFEINVDSLILEVTRRCNAYCVHCLRGEQQDMDMSREVIDKVLDTVSQISSVTFTGGEPTLNLDLIRYFFEEAERRNKMPTSFFIATNGMENQFELACLLLQYYPKMEEQDYCEVCISQDTYHPLEKGDHEVRENPLTGLVFYQAETKAHESYEDDRWLINEGRAYENGIGTRMSWGVTQLNIDVLDESYLSIEQLYVSANGNIQCNCDLSYDNIDDDPVTTIDELREHIRAAAEEEKNDEAETA